MSMQQCTFDHQHNPLNIKQENFFDTSLSFNARASNKHYQPLAHAKAPTYDQAIQCLTFDIYCRHLFVACGFCLILAFSFSSFSAQASEIKSSSEPDTKAETVIESTAQLAANTDAQQEQPCPEQLVEFWSNLSTDHRHRIDVPAFLLHTNCMYSKRSTEFHLAMLERLDNPSNPKLTEQLERLFNAQL